MTARPSSGKYDANGIARFCDVVMKGGVTSGIVYPRALCHLATQFNLRNIGGTSVGAIAASIAAAAEYQRRQTGSGAGYEALDALPAFLSRGKSLLHLFAADPVAAPLLRIALKLIGSDSLPLRIMRAILAAAQESWWQALIPVAIVAYSFRWSPLPQATRWDDFAHGVIPTILLMLLFAVSAVVAALVRYYIVLTNNDYGFCHAYSSAAAKKFEADLADLQRDGKDITGLQPEDTPPLFNWLEAFIARAAGRGRADPPLTIGDLSKAKFPEWYEDDGAASIDFQTVTTCLTLSRPFGLPFDSRNAGRVECTAERRPDRPTLYFSEAELSKYFSPEIVAHLKRTGCPVPSELQDCAERLGIAPIYGLPTGDDLPVVVAVRLSMSFPILFCAVRLWAPDPTKGLQPMWFSDGGLSSNFPIHLFDSPLPRWPTFALDLLGDGTMQVMDGDKVITPIPSSDAFLESEQPAVPLECNYPLSGKRGSLLQFLSSMIDSMRTWQDTTLGALPGNTSRTIGIRLPTEEGGLNLNMTEPQICDLIARGDLAGQTLLEEFVGGDFASSDTPAWRQQRWWRYLSTMQSTIRWTKLFQRGYSPYPWLKQDAYEYLCERSFDGNPTAPEMPGMPIRWTDPAEAESAAEAAATFDKLPITDAADDAYAQFSPVPEAALRQRAPL